MLPDDWTELTVRRIPTAKVLLVLVQPFTSEINFTRNNSRIPSSIPSRPIQLNPMVPPIQSTRATPQVTNISPTPIPTPTSYLIPVSYPAAPLSPFAHQQLSEIFNTFAAQFALRLLDGIAKTAGAPDNGPTGSSSREPSETSSAPTLD